MGMRTSHSRYGAQKVQDKKKIIKKEITVIIISATATGRHNNYTAGVIISPVSQVRKRRLRKVQALVYGHTARKWWVRGSSPDSEAPEPTAPATSGLQSKHTPLLTPPIARHRANPFSALAHSLYTRETQARIPEGQAVL